MADPPREIEAQLAAFAAVRVKHPRLEEADQAVTRAIEAHIAYTHLLLYGPSGVGKSTMVERITARFRAAEPNGLVVPVVRVEASPGDYGSYTRLDYYKQVLRALKEHVLVKDLLVNMSLSPSPPPRVSRHLTEWLDLREAVEQAFARVQVKAVIIDEAQHLMQVQPPLKPVDQLDWLKSMTNRTSVLHVLVGPFDLFDFRNLNGQAARRGREVYFPRYHVETLAERQEFVGAVRYLLERVPLACDQTELLSRWRWLAEWSLGCVGMLRDWFVETVSTILKTGGTTFTVEALARDALHPDKRVRLETEMRAGERKVAQGQAANLQELHALLGRPADGARSQPGDPPPNQPAVQASPPGQLGPSAPLVRVPKAAAGRPGQRAPQRDPVGTGTAGEPVTRCPFVGRLPLAAERLIASGVAKVECPECGAVRTLDMQGSRLLFPSHAKRLTRLTRQEARWIRQDSTWELFSLPTKEQHQ